MKLLMIILSFFMGALSWSIVSLVSNRFEPFDSDVGFYAGQSILPGMALGIGYRLGIREVCLFVAGVYVAVNMFSYLFGESEQRVWVFLGLATTISLIIYPTIFGFLGQLLRSFCAKFQ